jgi:hypothetical protein
MIVINLESSSTARDAHQVIKMGETINISQLFEAVDRAEGKPLKVKLSHSGSFVYLGTAISKESLKIVANWKANKGN